MKRTERVLPPAHVVQTNNVSNCLFPFVYTMIYDPSSRGAFRYLLVEPKSLLAWCTISVRVYSFASSLQVRLVRALGPGPYSSWSAVRVLGSMAPSAWVLGEGVRGQLEWAGAALMTATVSIYLLETTRWMDRQKGRGEEARRHTHGEDVVEDKEKEEELVQLVAETVPLLAGAFDASSRR
ncbi:hypothetical protein ACHAWF_001318 [Thalassiosira exigua]